MNLTHRFAFTLAPVVLAISMIACSSSSSSAATPDAATATGADDSGQAAASHDASTTAPDSGGGRDASTGAIEDAPSDASMAIAVADASAACTSFCSCMAMNCASEVFPGGCLYQCTTQTDWDLPCRANMCSLVPAQPNNDHCTHAFGLQECMNED